MGTFPIANFGIPKFLQSIPGEIANAIAAIHAMTICTLAKNDIFPLSTIIP
jgi:hypothetical protein